ncbi:uncharacterized protein LOC120277406 [Dioscorea cayenensis subsp. rotundata]|uniref:Uncharacterized protein LOC120277406 n=1 Tax=Dioscorea cayennensis subsp. rotundata TaxID=55577 RepID=A0AB40CN27_DIOCR|nr:uncharacterized protein LOC120277406 [Dioscorea cayenensis subsp. rotundata]
MAIQERLLQFKLHIIIAAISAVALFSLLRHGPSFSTVLSFFWPLLLSTGFFLAAVALLLRISPPPSDDAVPSPGEDLIDYVSSGLPEPHCSVEDELAGDEEEEEEQKGDHKKSQ